MTEYQLLYMGFLRARHDFPRLNHTGHEPVATAANCDCGRMNPWLLRHVAQYHRECVERDFGRTA